METLFESLKISPLKGHKFILLEDFVYKDVIVSKGYETNGADIPRIFWSFYPPNRTDYLPAVAVHDYLCEIAKDNKIKRKYADDMFEEILFELGINKFDIFILVYGVRLYSRLRYKVMFPEFEVFKERYMN